MVNFGKNSQNKPDSSSGNELQISTGKDVATALAEISYTIDAPCYLNVERSADV
jgi:hypothetical protein